MKHRLLKEGQGEKMKLSESFTLENKINQDTLQNTAETTGATHYFLTTGTKKRFPLKEA